MRILGFIQLVTLTMAILVCSHYLVLSTLFLIAFSSLPLGYATPPSAAECFRWPVQSQSIQEPAVHDILPVHYIRISRSLYLYVTWLKILLFYADY
jgi:hypothetical protein